MKKKVQIFINSEETDFVQYVEAHELDVLLESTKKVRSELAQFVDGKCVYPGKLPKDAIERISLRLHYEIN